MKRTIDLVAFLILLLAPVGSFAQIDAHSGLVLEGTVLNAEVNRRDSSEEKAFAEWRISLQMTVRNVGTQPILFFRRWTGEGNLTQKINFFSAEHGDGERLLLSHEFSWKEPDYSRFGLPKVTRVAVQRAPAYPDWFFIDDAPDGRQIVIIEPEGIFSFMESVKIEQAYKDRSTKGKTSTLWENFSDRRNTFDGKGISIADMPVFLISYTYESPDDLDAFNETRTRWSKFGVLPADSSGVFSITSKRILNAISYNKARY